MPSSWTLRRSVAFAIAGLALSFTVLSANQAQAAITLSKSVNPYTNETVMYVQTASAYEANEIALSRCGVNFTYGNGYVNPGPSICVTDRAGFGAPIEDASCVRAGWLSRSFSEVNGPYIIVSSGIESQAVCFGTFDKIVVNSGPLNDKVDVDRGDDVPRLEVDGGPGADTIYGSKYGDTIFGGSGADIDTIDGRDGNDYLHGGAGNDEIRGYFGADHIWGDEGSDSIRGETEDDTIWGGCENQCTDNSTDYIAGGNNSDTIHGEGGDDCIHGDIGQGRKTDASLCTVGTTDSSGTPGKDTITGDGGTDRIYGGGGNDDTLYGGSNSGTQDDTDYLYGEGGTDTLNGEGGGDRLYGGITTDNDSGGTSTDTINGGNGTDRAWGGGGVDKIYGGNDNDLIWGGDGSDNPLNGDGGTDTITGGINEDTINGGADPDKILADEGNCTEGGFKPASCTSLSDKDTIDCGSGVETYWQADPYDTIKLVGSGACELTDQEAAYMSGSDLKIDNGPDSFNENSLQFAGFGSQTQVYEMRYWTLYKDKDSGCSYPQSNNFSKMMCPNTAKVQANLGEGLDELHVFEAGISSYPGSSAVQSEFTVDGGKGNDYLYGGVRKDTLIGGDNDDHLNGHGGNNEIQGGPGKDTIYSNAKRPVGAPTNTPASVEILDGGSEQDEVDYQDSSPGGVDVDLVQTGQQDTDGGGYDTLRGFEDIIGSKYSDYLTGNSSDNEIKGDNEADYIEGRGGDDDLSGNSGPDTVGYMSAFAGVQVDLDVTTPQDTVGADTDDLGTFENLIGSDYEDHLYGDDKPNTIIGFEGNDTINGDLGADILIGHDDADWITAYDDGAEIDFTDCGNPKPPFTRPDDGSEPEAEDWADVDVGDATTTYGCENIAEPEPPPYTAPTIDSADL